VRNSRSAGGANWHWDFFAVWWRLKL